MRFVEVVLGAIGLQCLRQRGFWQPWWASSGGGSRSVPCLPQRPVRRLHLSWLVEAGRPAVVRKQGVRCSRSIRCGPAGAVLAPGR